MSEEKSPIIDIGDETIDIRRVVRVGSVGGDPAWLRYTIFFVGGSTMEVYETRRQADHERLTQMKREDFVKLWRELNSLF